MSRKPVDELLADRYARERYDDVHSRRVIREAFLAGWDAHEKQVQEEKERCDRL